MQIGSFEVYSIVTGTFRLDGGAMFGVVPKSLWANAVGVDELNRIDLATRTLLVVQRAEKRVILADTGCGSKWQDHSRSSGFVIVGASPQTAQPLSRRTRNSR